MTNPRRAERRWVAMARATLWGVSVGWHAEATQAAIIGRCYRQRILHADG